VLSIDGHRFGWAEFTMNRTPPLPSPAPRDDKERAVLEAAASVFLEHGFSAATTDTIQRKAGVSKATMYACFPSKEAIFTAVIERECMAMAESFKTMQPIKGRVATTLTELGMTYLRLVLSPSAMALFRVIVAEAPRFPNMGRLFYLAGPKVVNEKITAYLTEAAKTGEINIQSIGAAAAASLFTSMLRGEAHLEYLTHPAANPSDAQMDLWVQNAVTTFLGAYGATKPPRRRA